MMRRLSLPLSVRVPLIAAGMMVLVGIVASHQVLSALATAQEERLRELTRLHVQGLTVALGPAVLRQDVWEVYDTLDRASSAMEDQRMVLTIVADAAGRVIAASDPRRAPVDSDLAPLLGDAQPLADLRLTGSASRMRVVSDLNFQDRTVGQIVSEIDITDLQSERRRALLYLLAGNGLATLVLAAGGYFAVRRMLFPLRLLAGHMAKTNGTPQPIATDLVPKGDRELARLFETYNAMSGAAAAKVEAERRLAERERFVSLGRLSSSLAHEINNPLGGLLNAADTIRSYADRPEAVREAASLLDRGLKHLRDVVRATLEHNRLDRQGRPLELEDFEDLKLLFAPETTLRGQSLEWSVVAPPALLCGFPSAPVRQIALNLLLNAAAAAGAGGTVTFRAQQQDQTLQLIIQDNGPGMPPPAMNRLLTDDPVEPGGGVGLRLVRSLVLDLGGDVASTRRGNLTEIAVSLPVQVHLRC